MKNVFLFILALATSSCAFAAPSQPGSVITDFNCKTTRSGLDPIDYFYSKCTSYAGYTLSHDGADSRDWLAITSGQKKYKLVLADESFPNVVADQIEWRGYSKSDGQVEPYAIIYQVRSGTINSLAVAHISREGSCIIGSVVTSWNKRAHEEALNIADQNANVPCKF